jgi:ketosteroid isomerase-like protein
MSREDVQRWLDAYVEAWRSYDTVAIGDLFTDDAAYSYHPYDEPLKGRQAIIDSWLGDRDDPASWEASYAPIMLEGERAIAAGVTRYTDGTSYANLWVMRFAPDGRCSEYVEWFMQHPPE